MVLGVGAHGWWGRWVRVGSIGGVGQLQPSTPGALVPAGGCMFFWCLTGGGRGMGLLLPLQVVLPPPGILCLLYLLTEQLPLVLTDFMQYRVCDDYPGEVVLCNLEARV